MKYSYDAYKNLVVDKLEELLGKETVKSVSSTKNNGVKEDGVLMRVREGNMSPIMYFYDDSEKIYDDDDVESFVERALNVYEDARCNKGIDVDVLCDWKMVKKYVRPKVMNYKKNEEILKDYPHVRIMDLAVTFAINSENIFPDYGDGCIRVTEFLRKSFDVDTDTLYKQAVENMEREGYAFTPMSRILSLLGEEEYIDNAEAPKDILHFLTCYESVGGAVALLSNKILSEVCQTMNCERIFLLPSSINEVLTLNAAEMEVEKLQKLVKDVNGAIILPEEYLSDSVYLYDSVTGQLKNMGGIDDEQNGFDYLGCIA